MIIEIDVCLYLILLLSPFLSMQRLPSHSQYVQVSVVAKLHQEWIQRIMYLPQNHSIITCSVASQNSLVMRDIDGRRKPYIFNLMKVSTTYVDCVHSINVFLSLPFHSLHSSSSFRALLVLILVLI